MIVVGLDCGKRTGWCVFDATAVLVVESGVQVFDKRRGESNGLMFMWFRKWVYELLEGARGIFDAPGDLIIVAYEQAHFRGGPATEIGVGMQTRVQEAAAALGMESAPVPTSTLKLWATGHGKASKEDMMRASVMWLGRDPLDDNEADAVLIAVWAAEQYAPPQDERDA